MNYFSSPAAAERYARSRPFFHPRIREAIRRRLPEGAVFKRGLDVACGTGMSTQILAQLARQVIGIDPSPAMIGQAYPQPNIEYRVGSAESLAFPESHFDILTVALAFHWLDRSRFLENARRVLEPRGLMVIYNHWFAGELTGNPEFTQWHRTSYLARYPTPARDVRPFEQSDAIEAGFTDFAGETFTHGWPFGLEDLARYLTTQSNVIAAIEAGRETDEEAYAWIVSQLQNLWKSQHEIFPFHGLILFARNGKAA